MTAQPPKPVAKAFMMCEQIVDDKHTDALVIVTPKNHARLPHFPAALALTFFARLRSAHGSYHVALELRTLDGTVIQRIDLPEPLVCNDPLAIGNVILRQNIFLIPQAGKYEIVLLANNEEIASDLVMIALPEVMG